MVDSKGISIQINFIDCVLQLLLHRASIFFRILSDVTALTCDINDNYFLFSFLRISPSVSRYILQEQYISAIDKGTSNPQRQIANLMAEETVYSVYQYIAKTENWSVALNPNHNPNPNP